MAHWDTSWVLKVATLSLKRNDRHQHFERVMRGVYEREKELSGCMKESYWIRLLSPLTQGGYIGPALISIRFNPSKSSVKKKGKASYILYQKIRRSARNICCINLKFLKAIFFQFRFGVDMCMLLIGHTSLQRNLVIFVFGICSVGQLFCPHIEWVRGFCGLISSLPDFCVGQIMWAKSSSVKEQVVG